MVAAAAVLAATLAACSANLASVFATPVIGRFSPNVRFAGVGVLFVVGDGLGAVAVAGRLVGVGVGLARGVVLLGVRLPAVVGRDVADLGVVEGTIFEGVEGLKVGALGVGRILVGVDFDATGCLGVVVADEGFVAGEGAAGLEVPLHIQW